MAGTDHKGKKARQARIKTGEGREGIDHNQKRAWQAQALSLSEQKSNPNTKDGNRPSSNSFGMQELEIKIKQADSFHCAEGQER